MFNIMPNGQILTIHLFKVKVKQWTKEQVNGTQRKCVSAKFSHGKNDRLRLSGRWILNSVFKAWLWEAARKKKKIKRRYFQSNKCHSWLIMGLGVRETSQKGKGSGWWTAHSTRPVGHHLDAGSDTCPSPIWTWVTPTHCEGWRRSLAWSSPKEIGQDCVGPRGSLPGWQQMIITYGAPSSAEFWWPRQHYPYPFPLPSLPDFVWESTLLHITHVLQEKLIPSQGPGWMEAGPSTPEPSPPLSEPLVVQGWTWDISWPKPKGRN